jgi:hypothetical protein
MVRRYGRIFGPDDRDRRYQIKRQKSDRKYRFWYDNRWWGDQLVTPHCVGFSWTHWLTNVPVVSYLDPDGIYHLAQQNDEWKGTNYDGTSVRAGAKVLKMLGLIERYEWCWDLDRLVETLLEKGPVVVGTDWTRGMDNPDSKGMIHATGRNLGGHAYLLTGVSLARETFRIKNSWGREWGKDGRAYISFEDMEKLIKAEGEVCLAVERLAKPPKLSRSSIQTYRSKGKPKERVARKRPKRQRPIQQIVE